MRIFTIEQCQTWPAREPGARLTARNQPAEPARPVSVYEPARISGEGRTPLANIVAQRSDGYFFYLFAFPGAPHEPWVSAGCREMSLADARVHWGPPHRQHDESTRILDLLEAAMRAERPEVGRMSPGVVGVTTAAAPPPPTTIERLWQKYRDLGRTLSRTHPWLPDDASAYAVVMGRGDHVDIVPRTTVDVATRFVTREAAAGWTCLELVCVYGLDCGLRYLPAPFEWRPAGILGEPGEAMQGAMQGMGGPLRGWDPANDFRPIRPGGMIRGDRLD